MEETNERFKNERTDILSHLQPDTLGDDEVWSEKKKNRFTSPRNVYHERAVQMFWDVITIQLTLKRVIVNTTKGKRNHIKCAFLIFDV